MKNKIVFFDFDGVIADSFDAALAVNKMIHPLITEEAYRKRFEGNINESTDEETVKKKIDEDVDFFREYAPLLMQCSIFPGMKDVVSTAAQKHTLVIISSSTTDI